MTRTEFDMVNGWGLNHSVMKLGIILVLLVAIAKMSSLDADLKQLHADNVQATTKAVEEDHDERSKHH